MARLFFALWPDEETRTQLDNVTRQFKNEDIRRVKKSNLHITLEFLGEVSDETCQNLIDEISKLRGNAFSLELTTIGWWKKPQNLWIGTKQIPTPLLNLVKSIKTCVKQQGLKPDQRVYKPHVTIARKVKCKKTLESQFSIKWNVSSFALIVSKSTDAGVEYHPIKEWSLSL